MSCVLIGYCEMCVNRSVWVSCVDRSVWGGGGGGVVC